MISSARSAFLGGCMLLFLLLLFLSLLSLWLVIMHPWGYKKNQEGLEDETDGTTYFILYIESPRGSAGNRIYSTYQ